MWIQNFGQLGTYQVRSTSARHQEDPTATYGAYPRVTYGKYSQVLILPQSQFSAELALDRKTTVDSTASFLCYQTSHSSRAVARSALDKSLAMRSSCQIPRWHTHSRGWHHHWWESGCRQPRWMPDWPEQTPPALLHDARGNMEGHHHAAEPP